MLLCCLFPVALTLVKAEQNTADINMIACDIEQKSTMQVRVGDIITFGAISAGGFFESRNEPLFNQNILPNHSWRGVLSFSSAWPVFQQVQSTIDAIATFEHESAHATMGIKKPTLNPFYMIFDNTYRKVSLNAGKAGARIYMYDQVQTFSAYATIDGYLNSKNTPELPGLKTGSSFGLSCGGFYRHAIVGYMDVFISLHNRYIHEGSRKEDGEIFVRKDGTLRTSSRDYPLIAATNTFSVCTGMGIPLFQSRHRLELYGRWLYGSPYGYVDSRDIRNFFAVGCALSRY